MKLEYATLKVMYAIVIQTELIKHKIKEHNQINMIKILQY